MKRLTILLGMALLCLTLTGCSAVAFWLSGCGSPDADLVVISNSKQAVWSITLDYGNETQGIQSARNQALMEKGQSYGLSLEDRAEQVTVILSGRFNQELARTEVDFAGDRLYLTLERDGSLTVSEARPDV